LGFWVSEETSPPAGTFPAKPIKALGGKEPLRAGMGLGPLSGSQTERPPAGQNGREDRMERVLERALDWLAEIADVNHREAPRNAVHIAAKELGVKLDAETFDALASRVLEEGKLWQKEALQRVLNALGVSLPPWAEGRLTPEKSGYAWPAVWVFLYEGRREPRVRVFFSPPDRLLNFPLPKDRPFEPLVVRTWPGGVRVEVSQEFWAQKGWAYVLTDSPWRFEKALRGARLLAPLLAFLGLADLEGALPALEGLGDGEARMWGPYLLARGGHARVLFRGSLTGTPALDGALLLGREAVLQGTGGVTVRLRAKVWGGGLLYLGIEEGILEWDGERAHFKSGEKGARLYKGEAFSSALREALRTALKAEPAPSPRMRALVEELTAGEDPLEALRARDLPQRVHLRLLSWH
jgi:hypothetical protein